MNCGRGLPKQDSGGAVDVALPAKVSGSNPTNPPEAPVSDATGEAGGSSRGVPRGRRVLHTVGERTSVGSRRNATVAGAAALVRKGAHMAAPDVTSLQATIHELRAELSQNRIQAEVFRALYTRQAMEIEHLRTQLHETDAGTAPRRLQLIPGPAARHDPVPHR